MNGIKTGSAMDELTTLPPFTWAVPLVEWLNNAMIVTLVVIVSTSWGGWQRGMFISEVALKVGLFSIGIYALRG